MEDVLRVHTGDLVHDLGAYSGNALAHAGGTGADVHLAVHHSQAAAADIRQAYTHAAVLHAAGNACVGAALVGFLHGLQALGITGFGAGDLAIGQHLTGTDGVAVTDLPGADAHLFGQQIQVQLGSEAALGHAEAAERTAGHVVGVNADAGDVHILEVVGTAAVGAGTLQNGAAQAGVSAAVGDQGGLHGQQLAVLVTGGGHVHFHGMALGVDVQAFLTAELHLYGAAGGPGHQRRVVLHAHIFLAAEAAAHQLGLAANLLGRNLQHAGDFLLLVVYRLAGGVHQQAALAVRNADGALRLHEGMVGHGGGVMLGHHIGRAGDHLFGVTALEHFLGEDVALFMQLRSIRLHGLDGIGEGLQLGVGHVHQVQDLVQGLLVVGGHQHNGVANVAGAVALGDQHIPVLDDVAGLVEGHVLGGEDLHHVGMGQSAGQVDLLHTGSGVLGTQSLGVDHAGNLDVIHEQAGAQHLLLHVHAGEVSADAGLAVVLRNRQVLTEHLGSQQDGLLDAHITGAAADVAADGLLHILAGGVQVLIQQALGADHHAGDAEAALHRAGLAEGVHVNRALALGQAFHGGDVLAVQLFGGEHAGLGLLAVHQDGAGAAGALAAAVLHAGQPQVLPQVLQQFNVFVGVVFHTVYI